MHTKKILSITCFVLIAIVSSFVWYQARIKKSNLNKQYTQAIFNSLQEYQVTYDIDKYSVGLIQTKDPQIISGKEECLKNINYFVENNLPFTMLLIGFPFKARNYDKKTFGPLADMAERKSLEYLNGLLDTLKTVYPLGARLVIYCDGIFFNEFFGIRDDEVTTYENTLKQLVRDLPNISFITSQDEMHKNNFKSLKEVINFIDTYPPTTPDFIKNNPSLSSVALKRFSFELDHALGRRVIEKYNDVENLINQLLAREMRLRSYIQSNFSPNAFFRLTAHLSQDSGRKFGIKLSPSGCITPYHGVMVQEKDNSWTLKFKKDVDLNSYKETFLTINDIVCPYYLAY